MFCHALLPLFHGAKSVLTSITKEIPSMPSCSSKNLVKAWFLRILSLCLGSFLSSSVISNKLALFQASLGTICSSNSLSALINQSSLTPSSGEFSSSSFSGVSNSSLPRASDTLDISSLVLSGTGCPSVGGGLFCNSSTKA